MEAGVEARGTGVSLVNRKDKRGVVWGGEEAIRSKGTGSKAR